MPSKYSPLARHLVEKDQDMLRMTFAEVEQVISENLPPAARNHRAWWSNNTNNTAARHGWLKVGWESSQVDMDKREVVFVRQSPAKAFHQSLSKSPRIDPFRATPGQPLSLDAQLAEVVRVAGGVENLHLIARAIQRYIAGDLLETELGQILRRHWPRGS